MDAPSKYQVKEGPFCCVCDTSGHDHFRCTRKTTSQELFSGFAMLHRKSTDLSRLVCQVLIQYVDSVATSSKVPLATHVTSRQLPVFLPLQDGDSMETFPGFRVCSTRMSFLFFLLCSRSLVGILTPKSSPSLTWPMQYASIYSKAPPHFM